MDNILYRANSPHDPIDIHMVQRNIRGAIGLVIECADKYDAWKLPLAN